MSKFLLTTVCAFGLLVPVAASAGWDGGPWECDGGLTVELVKVDTGTTQIVIEGPIGFGRSVPPDQRGGGMFDFPMADGLNLKFDWVVEGEELVPLLNGKRCRIICQADQACG